MAWKIFIEREGWKVPVVPYKMASLLLMVEILHQLIGSLSDYLQGFYTSQAVQDLFHQQYERPQKWGYTGENGALGGKCNVFPFVIYFYITVYPGLIWGMF